MGSWPRTYLRRNSSIVPEAPGTFCMPIQRTEHQGSLGFRAATGRLSTRVLMLRCAPRCGRAGGLSLRHRGIHAERPAIRPKPYNQST